LFLGHYFLTFPVNKSLIFNQKKNHLPAIICVKHGASKKNNQKKKILPLKKTISGTSFLQKKFIFGE